MFMLASLLRQSLSRHPYASQWRDVIVFNAATHDIAEYDSLWRGVFCLMRLSVAFLNTSAGGLVYL